MPLTNAYLEEEKEVELYTIPFVDNLDNPVGSPVMLHIQITQLDKCRTYLSFVASVATLV
jgi:hypothetical protein